MWARAALSRLGARRVVTTTTTTTANTTAAAAVARAVGARGNRIGAYSSGRCLSVGAATKSPVPFGQLEGRRSSRAAVAGGFHPLVACRDWRGLSTQAGQLPGNKYGVEAVAGRQVDPDYSNITPSLASKVQTNLHLQPAHPLNTIKTLIEDYFSGLGAEEYQFFDDLHPVVTTQACFDDLLVQPDHVSRQKSDTYYVDRDHVLRTHTSAHQTEKMRAGVETFLLSGEVFRRDEIDASHYPVFHQMEGVHIFPNEDITIPEIEAHLKERLEGMADRLFGADCEKRWVEAYFPFTEPSLEMEVFFDGEWLEVLGCGVVHQNILDKCGIGHKKGWAFGLGLERLAMVLFGITDIRLFWSQDPRFLTQFEAGKVTTFKPFSKYPPCFKDISFWVPDGFHENDLFEEVRSIGGDLIERVHCIDEFTHPKTGRASQAYRITYRSMERTLTDTEVDELNFRVRDAVADNLACELR